MRTAARILALGLVALSAPASADVYLLGGPIEGSQEVTLCPGGGSTKGGTLSAQLDDATGLFSWTVTYGSAPSFTDGALDGGTVSGMHFHGPAAAGVNAGIKLNIGTISGLGTPNSGSVTLGAGDIADVKNELWYVNVHSSPTCTGGEIRGQLLVITTVPALPGAGR